MLSQIVEWGTAIDEKEWAATIKETGLRRMSRDSNMWHIVDATGEVRAQGFFGKDGSEATFWVLFFPSQREAVPDAILKRLIETAQSTQVEEGEYFTIFLPQQKPIKRESVTGTVQRSLHLRIQGGSLFKTMIYGDLKRGLPPTVAPRWP